MASNIPLGTNSGTLASVSFSLGIALRALTLAGLGFLLLYLISETQYYATVLVVGLIAVLVVLDLARAVTRLDRRLSTFLEITAAGASDRPIAANKAMENAASSVRSERRERMREAEYLQALADSVASALIVIEPKGRMVLANRAAWKLAGQAVNRLEEIAAIGPFAAKEITALPTGARSVVKLASGQHMLAASAQFFVPGEGAYRLLSLQNIAGELDAVELKAWQDMTRVLTHEIMNSLTPIASLSESLSSRLHEANADEDVADAIETIGRRSHGLMNFVERYRKLAEMPEPQVRPVDLKDFLAGIDRLMRPTMKEKNIAYQSEAAPVATIEADANLLTQAVINLLHNAMDAVAGVEKPGIVLSGVLENNRAAICVTDNGCGLDPERLDNIFVPFFTTKPNGSGIGLSLVRQIVLSHRGQIEFSKNNPRGAIFRILLPVSGNALAAEANNAAGDQNLMPSGGAPGR